MSLKDTFTREEWFKIMTGPGRAGAAIVASSPSGVTGLLAEARAIADSVRDNVSRAGRTPLMEAMAADLLGTPPTADELKGMDVERARGLEDAKRLSLEGVRQAVWLVSSKASPEDAAAYRAMLLEVAQKTAHAAKEGGFLGMGGEQVNDKERAMLAELEALLGPALTAGGTVTHETPPLAAPGPDGSGNSN